MNNQTKTIAKVVAITFVIMLMTAALPGLAPNGHIDPIDTINPLNPGVIGNWVGRLGGVPLIAAWLLR